MNAIEEKPNPKRQPRSLREALEGKLTKSEMAQLVTSFDSLGSIAIIEIPDELKRKGKIIGEALLKVNKQFRTVCKVAGKHAGEFRVRPVKIIAGEKNTVADYRESGCRFKISVGKVFFSPRLGTERSRIAGLIKKGEIVGAFFAGVGPFPIVFAKNSQMEKAYAIELNPIAYAQMVENIALNKVAGKVEAIKGDVRKVVPRRLRCSCDRVVMPLPKSGEHFLRYAFMALKPAGGIVHFYQFVEKDKMFEEPLGKIKQAAKQAGRKVRILFKREVRTFSPSVCQIVIDFKVLGKAGKVKG
jgi:tRNA (guanine37-N1)-methyltransferase